VRIVRILIGMEALGQFAVSGLQFRVGGLFADSKDFVIISL